MTPIEKPQVNPSPEGLARLELMVNVVLGNLTGAGPGDDRAPRVSD